MNRERRIASRGFRGFYHVLPGCEGCKLVRLGIIDYLDSGRDWSYGAAC